jgi:hypothetical protein
MTDAAEIALSIFGSARTAMARLRVKSALNPMLWLCGIVTPAGLLASYASWGHEPLATIAAWLGVAPVAATIVGFLYFMIAGPQRLQSEEYQLRHEALELIREKGSSFEVKPSSVDSIANPVIHPPDREDLP